MTGALVEVDWDSIARKNNEEPNAILAKRIRDHMQAGQINCVVLAQHSMTVFLLPYPNPRKELGLPVHTIGKCGF
jgi:hypothetical protein